MAKREIKRWKQGCKHWRKRNSTKQTVEFKGTIEEFLLSRSEDCVEFVLQGSPERWYVKIGQYECMSPYTIEEITQAILNTHGILNMHMCCDHNGNMSIKFLKIKEKALV